MTEENEDSVDDAAEDTTEATPNIKEKLKKMTLEELSDWLYGPSK